MAKISANTQNLIGCGVIAALLLVGATVYVLWSAYSFMKSAVAFGEINLPEELQQPRILTGNGFLAKTEIFNLNKDEYIQTIVKSVSVTDEKERQKIIESDTAKEFYNFSALNLCGNEIIAAGEFGGYLFDLEGKLKREILFEPTTEKTKIGWYEHTYYKQNLANLEIVKLKRGEACGFISFNSVTGATVYNNQGNIIWNYGKRNIDTNDVWTERKNESLGKEMYVLRATAGDLNNDGIAEFIVAQNNNGIHAFDFNGVEKWFQPDEFPYNQLLITDLEHNRNQLIEYGTHSKIRDEDGNLVKSFEGGENCLFLDQQNGNKELQFIDLNDNKLTVKNERGEKIMQADAPLSEIKLKEPRKVNTPFYPELSYINNNEHVYHPKSVWINLQKDKPKYLAVVGSFIGLPRSQFYVYDSKGNLVYQEILPENAETIAILPRQDGTENILIGGKDTIWKFSAN